MTNPVGRNVLSGQYGYPNKRFQGSFDPALGRGHRGGDRVVIPAGETVTLVNYGLQDGYFRWKVSLLAEGTDDGVYDVQTAYPLLVQITGKYENDVITRTPNLSIGRNAVVYVPGRTLNVLATNPTDQPIAVHYSLDEATPGLSAWTSDDTLTIAAETDLDIPPFASTLQLFGLTGGTNWTLRGYDSGGTVVYQEILNSPRSAQVPISPSLFYTVEPTAAGTHAIHALFQCVG